MIETSFLKRHWRLLLNLFTIAASAVICVVYLAFGTLVNIVAIVLAYAVANFAGLVSVLPGGAGIYEALMTALLIANGIPARLSLPATVMYQVLNTLIQLPPSYVLYHSFIQGAPKGVMHYE